MQIQGQIWITWVHRTADQTKHYQQNHLSEDISTNSTNMIGQFITNPRSNFHLINRTADYRGHY